MKAIMITLALFGLLLAAGPALHAQGDNKARQILALTNQDRAAQGLPPLAWNDQLAAAAAIHLDRMMQEPALSHQYPGEPALPTRAAQAGAHFRAVAENLAMGYDPKAIEQEWMHSTAHRTNILDPRMNAIGIAVVTHGGYDYAVEDFADAIATRTPAQVEQAVADLLRAQHIDPSGPREEAEAACRTSSGYPPHVKSIIRYETPDLSQLPPQVVAVLRRGQFTRAAVGACPPGNSQPNFTTFRIALLLY